MTTILLYGRTNSGKSTQIGRLAEHVYATTKRKTRLYTADRGGIGPIEHYVDLGLIDVVPQGATDPWVFLHKAVRGYVRDGKTGKWVLHPDENATIGCYAFESIRSIAEALLADLVRRMGQGVSIGGGPAVAFTVNADGESLKVAGGNQTIYGVVQSRMTEEIWESQRLPGQYLIWTSSVSKDEDPLLGSKVVGPDVIGRALTTDVPRWFHYTFRLDVLPARGKDAPERHLLYLGTTADESTGNSAGLGNTRRPLDAPPLPKTVIEPADIVEALTLLAKGKEEAKAAVRRRLGLSSS